MANKSKYFQMFNATMLSFLMTACATTHQAQIPAAGYTIDVNEGDKVKIVMNDGKEHSFQVTRVDEIGLYGKDDSFTYTEMRSVNVTEQRPFPKQTLWLVLALVAVAVFAEADDNGSGPLCLYASNDPDPDC